MYDILVFHVSTYPFGGAGLTTGMIEGSHTPLMKGMYGPMSVFGGVRLKSIIVNGVSLQTNTNVIHKPPPGPNNHLEMLSTTSKLDVFVSPQHQWRGYRLFVGQKLI